MTDKKRTIPEISVDTRLLYQAIQELEPDEIIEYSKLSKLIGRDVRGAARSNLMSARKMAERDDAIVVECVQNVGIKRLTDQEIVSSVGGHARKRIRRTAGRAVRKLHAVEFDKLSTTEKIRQNAELSQLSAVKAFSGDNTTKRIEPLVTVSRMEQLAIAKTLEAFTK